MGYMIEGGGSPTMSKAKHWLTDHNEASHRLLFLLTGEIVDYFGMQVKPEFIIYNILKYKK